MPKTNFCGSNLTNLDKKNRFDYFGSININDSLELEMPWLFELIIPSSSISLKNGLLLSPLSSRMGSYANSIFNKKHLIFGNHWEINKIISTDDENYSLTPFLWCFVNYLIVSMLLDLYAFLNDSRG